MTTVTEAGEGRGLVDQLKELDPLLVAMARHAFGDDFAMRQLDGSEQSQPAVARTVARQDRA